MRTDTAVLALDRDEASAQAIQADVLNHRAERRLPDWPTSVGTYAKAVATAPLDTTMAAAERARRDVQGCAAR